MYNPPHPGEILREDYLIPLELTMTSASEALLISKKGLSEIVNGHTGISPAMALKLGRAFNTTPQLWLNLQHQYDLWKTEQTLDLKGIIPLFISKAK